VTGPAEESCRIDVWLWRARFFKTRNLAARMVTDGRIRLLRGAAGTRLDKPSRNVRRGDGLLIALGQRSVAVQIEALGARRGPAPEARALYSVIDAPERQASSAD
jgi:ribosome-associated heat shock protein Hsp15